MEGFVFDLQRFAGNAIYELFFGNTYSQGYYYIETNVSDGIVTPDYNSNAPISTTNDANRHINVNIIENGTRIVGFGNSVGYGNIISLDFSGANSYAPTNKKIFMSGNALGTPRYDIVGIEGLKITESYENILITCGPGNTEVTLGGIDEVTANTMYVSSGTFSIEKSDINHPVICTGAVNVSGTGVAKRQGSNAITVTGGDITITGDNGTVNVKSGASVTIGSQTYTSRDDSSSLSVSGSTVTLTAGVFAASITEFTLNSGAGVQWGTGNTAVVYTAKETTSKGMLDYGVMTLTAGTFSSDKASTFKVGPSNSTSYTTYITTKKSTFKVSGNEAIFSAGAMTLATGESITVSGNNATSKITATSGSVNVEVSDGKYTISNLANGDSVSIDGRTYSYTVTDGVGKLLYNGIGWQKSNVGDSASITFSIAGGTGSFTDTLSDNSWSTCAPNLANKDDLKTLIDNLTGTLYFDASGNQLPENSGAAYELKKDGSNYTLTSIADSALTIDLTEVDTDKLANLTINLATGNGAQQVKLKDGAGLGGLTLGAGDSVLASDGTTVLAKAGTASGTVTVASGKVTALTGGSFVGVGEHNIDATSVAVTIDGVTFAAGAKGTFTNGAEAAADTFAVTTGTASIDSNFQGTTVTAHEVTYTVVPPTVATFSGTANEVTNFTSGKITFTAADNASYTIGNQTISDGNGAELTFVATNTNTYLCSTGEDAVSLSAGKSITISDANGTNPKVIAAGEGSTIDVAVTDGKYTLSDLDNGEKVTIGDKTYLYRGNTGFLEELDGNDGTGRGYRLKPAGDNATIAFTNAGVLDTNTADALPGTMAGDAGQFAIVCSLVEENLPFQFKADGTRAVGNDPVAYTLTKSGSGYTLTSTNNANSDITLDASGLTGLTVDLTAGNGTQTLKVNNATTLSSDSKLGAGDTITDGTNILLTANDATTLSVAAGPDISVAPGANVTVPATPGIKTAGNGTYKVNGISVTTSGDSSEPFISIIPDTGDSNTTGLTLQGIAESETFTANTAGKNYTVGGQTFKKVSAGVTINGAGTATLTGTQSVTVGTNNTVIQPISGNGVQVTLTGGKYILSGLEDGEEVSLGGKKYLYRANTKFLEEYNDAYPEGSGDGFILDTDGSISFDADGKVDTNTATSMPSSLGTPGALDIISRAMPEGNTYYFNASGGRADSKETAAYTLNKASGKLVLKSTSHCDSSETLDIDARGLTGLTVDFSAGNGKQTLNVNEKTELAENSRLGAGDVIKYDSGTYVTCGTGTTSVSLTPGQPMTIEDMKSGTTVSVEPGKSVKVGNSVYKAADTGVTIGAADDGTIGVKSGTLSATSGTYTMLTSDGTTVGDTVEVSGDTEVEIAPDENGKATIKGLDEVGEKVIIKDSSGNPTTTYEVIAQNIVKKVDKDGNTTYLNVKEEDPVFKEEGDTGVDVIDGAPVSPKDAEYGTTVYNADGKPLPSGSEGAAILTKNGNGSTLEVRQDMVLGVQLDEGTVTVKDKGTDTTYTVNGTEISASGATFTSAGGVVSDVTGTLTVKKGTLDTKDGSADARYTLNDGTEVNFQEGSPLSGTKVTTSAGNTITIEENNNNNPTTVDSEGNITGVDSGAEIKGVPDGATVTTTGNGSLTLNGKTWEVRGDSDGATFTASSGSISGVTGLAEGATLSTTDNVSGLTLNGCTIASARNGISYTAGSNVI